MPKDTPESFENTLLCNRRKFKLSTNQIDDYPIPKYSTTQRVPLPNPIPNTQRVPLRIKQAAI